MRKEQTCKLLCECVDLDQLSEGCRTRVLEVLAEAPPGSDQGESGRGTKTKNSFGCLSGFNLAPTPLPASSIDLWCRGCFCCHSHDHEEEEAQAEVLQPAGGGRGIRRADAGVPRPGQPRGLRVGHAHRGARRRKVSEAPFFYYRFFW